MMRSLYSGITGLRNHQTRMDVIGNNIANVNTAGFKSSRVVFSDIFSQTISPASGGTAASGGVNPQQIGLGASISTIDVLHTPSASQYTGAPLDVSIEGSGYFVLSSGGQTTYSRAGNFYTDGNHNLVNLSGAFVQGYVGGSATPSNIVIDSKYKDVSISDNGEIIGIDSTAGDARVTIAFIALATFPNENALEKVGQSSYRSTSNSGVAIVNKPGEQGAGTLSPGFLEMSNVDLAGEFTDMIVTQRGFQANSRIITTTDSMLEELVNLKR